ncbi:MAG: beta-lactamase family protein [Chitinophagaceae bacterium]|nr:beta-lactamase family protein [Chitinophagaceae bacterium]
MVIKIFKTDFCLTFLLLILSCNSNAKNPKPDNTKQFGKVVIDYSDTSLPAYKQMIFNLDTFYNRQVNAGFNGSVLIGYKGKILYERYFGFSQKESGALWSPLSQSQLASTSKTLTSGAILLLKDKGLLDLDDYVTKHIPTFPYQDITVRMLLNHRSGLPDYIHFAPKPVGKMYLENDDVLNLFATKKQKLKFTPNTKFNYSNSNFVMLASIVQSVSGMKFEYFMKRFIFNPLGMKNTFVVDPNKERVCTAAFCYKANWQLEPDMHLDGVVGDKGVYSTVQDLYKWDQALYSNRLLKYSTLLEAFKPYSFETGGAKNYGLGWRMLNYEDGQKIVYHNGWWHGNNTCFYRFIQDNFTIIVLGNRFSKSIYRQPMQIYNIVMGSNEKVNSELEPEE